MKRFQDFIKEQECPSDIRTEMDDISKRIRRSNMVVGNARTAEINDVNDALLSLKSVVQEFLNTLEDISTGRSVHV